MGGSNSAGTKQQGQTSTPTKTEASAETDSTKPLMQILFGSQTGTAEEYANNFATEAKRYGFRTKVIDLVDVESLESLGEEESLCIFVVATYGEGEPTDNARDFFEWLKDEKVDTEVFSKMKYAVFGLGNKQYKIYQAVARFFDKRFEELGAKRAFEKGEGDADGNMEEDFEDWKSRALPEVSALYNLTAQLGEEKIEPKYDIKYYEDVKNADSPYEKSKGVPDNKSPFLSTVTVNRQLLNDGSHGRSTVHVEFDISECKNIYYEAGDHLAVLAENPKLAVQRIIKRMNMTPEILNRCFSLNQKQNKTATYFPKRCTFAVALQYLVDLESTPRKNFIRACAQYATEETEVQKLKLLSSNTQEGKEYFTKYIRETGKTLVDLLEDFSSVKMPLEHFMELVPRLQPRYYSIASSSQMNPTSIHVVVAVVRYTIDGRQKEGLCSSYIERLQPGTKAYIYVRISSFHLPSDSTKPVIMVGPGTGLAPFRGFLQQREAMLKKGRKLGNAWLYFGCRKKDEDYIYREELEGAASKGAITSLYVAFSRDQAQKEYVQNLMEQHREEIYKALFEQGGYFYICGDAKYMAKDVDRALVSIVQEFGKKTKEEAEKVIAKMTTDKKYLTDVWSA